MRRVTPLHSSHQKPSTAARTLSALRLGRPLRGFASPASLSHFVRPSDKCPPERMLNRSRRQRKEQNRPKTACQPTIGGVPLNIDALFIVCAHECDTLHVVCDVRSAHKSSDFVWLEFPTPSLFFASRQTASNGLEHPNTEPRQPGDVVGGAQLSSALARPESYSVLFLASSGCWR